MGCAENINTKIIEIFQSSQLTSAVHQKNGIILKTLYERTEHDTFFNAFKGPLSNILFTDFKNRNVYAEKSIDFVGSFCVLFKPVPSGEDVLEHQLFTDIMDYLLEASECVRDAVRFRSCQLINKILDCLVGSEVSVDLCDKLKMFMLERVKDSKTVIRMQALFTLYRLQDPTDPKDEVILKFVSTMGSDSFAKVRKLCVEKVAVRRDVIAGIVSRIRDVDAGVRLAAFKRLSMFAGYLSISNKRLILTCGRLDDTVKEYVTTTLIKTWLLHYEDNIIEFMKSLRLDANEKDISDTVSHYEFVLSAIFNQKNLKELSEVLRFDKKRLVPFEDLSWEVVAYWRIYLEHLFSNGYEDEIRIVQAEFTDLCRYIKGFYANINDFSTEQFLEQQFIIKQLFLIVRTYDFDDIARRNILNVLVKDVLIKIEVIFDVTQVIIDNLRYSIPNIESRCNFVNEIISEIIYPVDCEKAQKIEEEKQVEITKLKFKLNCLVDEQNEAIKHEQYMEADRLKHEIEQTQNMLANLKNVQNQDEMNDVQKKTDIPTVIKYLDISAALLLSNEIIQLIPVLKTLKNNILQELMIHDNDIVRAKAMQCYSLCCVLDKSDARAGIHIFSAPILAYNSGEEVHIQILLVCIAAVVDLLRLFGSNLLAEPSETDEDNCEKQQEIFTGGTSLTELIRGLVELLNDEEYEIQKKAGFGLSQLVLSERFQSATLVARLVLKWCTPTPDNIEIDGLKQLLGFTLQQIPTLESGANQLEEAALIVIQSLVFAPKTSPLCDVNVENIAKFLVALCKSSPKGSRIHTNLALSICSKMKENRSNKLNLVFSKMLLMLELSKDKEASRELLELCNLIRDEVTEKNVIKNVVKFVAKITEKMSERNSELEQVVEEENMEVDDEVFSETGRTP